MTNDERGPDLRSWPMDRDTMRGRVAAARVGRLATVTPAGEPHVVPCCFVLDGDTILSAVDAKPKSTLALRRLDNLRARPRAALLVDHYDDDWSTLWWVRADGDGRVIDAGAERERALDLLAAKYPQYRTRRPPGPVVAVAVTRWRAWP
jgi:PPOX class probable F420-dependent enzyme